MISIIKNKDQLDGMQMPFSYYKDNASLITKEGYLIEKEGLYWNDDPILVEIESLYSERFNDLPSDIGFFMDQPIKGSLFSICGFKCHKGKLKLELCLYQFFESWQTSTYNPFKIIEKLRETSYPDFECLETEESDYSAFFSCLNSQKELGVHETTENSSVRVDQYNSYVGVGKVAWCASLVSWCFGDAGYSKPQTACSPALFPSDRLANAPLSGMVFGIYFPHLKRIAHCGIVSQVKNDLVFSIEGNTNLKGSREGTGVYRRIRHMRSIYRFSDWTTRNSLKP